MERKILATAAFLGVTAIALGAFGAHGLKAMLTESQLTTFETGVKYQMYHALFLLFVGTTVQISSKTKNILFWLTSIGVLFFSGSIFLLSTAGITGLSAKVLGPVTPVGGLLLMAAWIVFFIKILGKKAE
ncbi:DUF423 domain-containing protein [Flavobacterium enshiense]|uniref:DUF423 domain-containing protein n=1 Tax=Flavobacterium enshiense TaxID=1341165 RepID=UPI00345D115A